MVCFIMKEFSDPITNLEMAVIKRLNGVVVTLFLTAFVICLIAPVLGPLIKRIKRQQYVMHTNYEELAENDMKRIRIVLWAIAAGGWTILFGVNFINYPY